MATAEKPRRACTGDAPSNGAGALVPEERLTLSGEDFLGLVDVVLAEVGRPPLGAEQRAIVEVRDEDQVLQIIAGPGSGKTEVLVWRVLFELFVRGSEASRLMLTTFTRKAAQELNVRLVDRSDALLAAARAQSIPVDDPRVHDLRIGTIHALCDQLLSELDREHLEHGTQLVDDAETRVRLLREWGWLFHHKEGRRQVLKEVLAVPELDALFRAPWNERALFGMSQVDFTLLLFNQHTETWIPRCAAEGRPNGLERFGHPGLTDDLVWLQERWENYLDRHHILDFATLQKRFLERQQVVQGQLDHVFVDEFQDTNPIQAAIHLAWIRTVGARLTVVGDDDQALYRFRGSDIACFANLERDCRAGDFAFRNELLQDNRRSTKNIVGFAQAFREATVLRKHSLPKQVRAPKGTPGGAPVRLLEGDWTALCERMLKEIDAYGTGRIGHANTPHVPSVAILMFSTSEAATPTNPKPARELREALEAGGLRVYNPRNKSAARPGSPIHQLLGLISYLIDPVSKAPAGTNGKPIEVWASMADGEKAAHALTARPDGVWVSQDHASIQKKLRKTHANNLEDPGPELAPLLAYMDKMRSALVDASERGKTIRLNLGGLVARLLRMEPFRSAGYTPKLFRQALFTQLLEANVAATRLTRRSLEKPLHPVLEDGKVAWPAEFWELLNYFGQFVAAGGQDDLEVEAFAENAVAMLTFHQAKGLEFDHVYVAMTGKEADPSSALATELFSGQTPSLAVVDKHPVTKDKSVLELAKADREREIYVAITRPKQTLTVLHSPTDERWAMDLNPGLAKIFKNGKQGRARRHHRDEVARVSDVIEVSYTGDLLAHRRCPRAWAYEKHAGFVPYEQVQAMEGRLLHHAMEWMSRTYQEEGKLATREEVYEQLERFYRILRSRGITTSFASREEVLERITGNLFRGKSLRKPVAAAIRGAEHTEYELRSVRKVLKTEFAGKNRILLTGIIDLVLQQQDPLTYRRVWDWGDVKALEGHAKPGEEQAASGDREIWDLKGSRIKTPYLIDYVRQVITYAALFRERTGTLPRRCVLFFVNESRDEDALLSIPVDEEIVDGGLRWTVDQVADLQRTLTTFEADPVAVVGGTVLRRDKPVGERVDEVLRTQCTGCAQRFDCDEYKTSLGSSGGRVKRDVSVYTVSKN